MIDLVDFHSHILPGMDDGAENEYESLRLLQDAYSQGVRVICATPHYYAFDESPESFLKRRSDSVGRLIAAFKGNPVSSPRIVLGAEVHYFSGMSESAELAKLSFGRVGFLLVEPPMEQWSGYMIDEIEFTGKKLRCVPVIAHVDRYMNFTEDYSLIDNLQGRKLLVQINNSFFLRESTEDIALTMLREEKIQFLGSDCHNLRVRQQNSAAVAARLFGEDRIIYEKIHKRARFSIFPIDN